MVVGADNEFLDYSGRIDFTQKESPLFVFPCSYVRMKFIGKKVTANIVNYHSYWNNYIGVICDGVQSKICVYDQENPVEDGVMQTIVLADNLYDSEHEIILFKRQDACHEFRFCGFEVEASVGEPWILDCGPKPYRKIEVYGDSVSAGEVSEAVDFVGKEDPEWHQGELSNSYYSYSWLLARRLNAQLHDIAQGGIALLNGTGWFLVNDGTKEYYQGMEEAYDRLQYNPTHGEVTAWDFGKYRPHVVVIAIGQNDNHPEDYMKDDYNCERAVLWREKYKWFVSEIRRKYPKAHIILATTILNHDENWDKSIDEVAKSLDDSKIHHFMYTKNGKGTPGHIRIPEAEQMAAELGDFIESLGESVWED